MNKIIVVVGMCGAGKSVACDYIETLGFQRIYFGAITFEKLKEANIEVTPENERMMREKLREEHGMGTFAILNLPKIEEAIKNGPVLIESLYSWEELKIIKDKFKEEVITIAIVVDKTKRYERLAQREVRRLTFEEAKKRDITEIENISKAGPIAYADYIVDNNYEIKDLQNRLKEIIQSIN